MQASPLFLQRIGIPSLILFIALAWQQPALAQAESPASAAQLASTVYPSAVREVVEQRCVACHGCYDAPCQLKMDAWMGLARGAHEDKVYDGTRLLSAQLTRLYEDATTIEGWRQKGFYSVLDAQDPRQGLAYQMLALKEEYPAPKTGRLPSNFDFSLD